MALKLKVGILGIYGKMGRTVFHAVTRQEDMTCVGGVDLKKDENLPVPVYLQLQDFIAKEKPQILVDFTVKEAALKNIELALSSRIPSVVGTTGFTEKEMKHLEKIALKTNTPCFIAPNFSIGAVLLMLFAQKASPYFSQAEIIEYHHDQKKDAPSGTAIRTASLMQRHAPPSNFGHPSRGELHSQVPVHSIRMEGLLAHQEVLFGKKGEVLTLRHDSLDRECFMDGVLLAIRKVKHLQGLVVGLEKLLSI